MGQLVQILGALAVLAGFVHVQSGRTTTAGRGYLILNLVGSAVLAADAWIARQWGFLLLEGAWAGISVHGLVRRRRRPRAAAAPPVRTLGRT